MTKKPTIDEMQAKIDELTDALLRERADAVNVRRRAEEEKKNMSTVYKANVVRELLPVVDNFERSLKHVPEDLKNNDYIKGIQSIVRQFEDVLASIGVKRIETVGVEFDPHFHEAVSHNESEDGDIVSEELQAGYTLGDEIIRHAIVKVN